MNWSFLFNALTAISAAVGSIAFIFAVVQLRFNSWVKAQAIFNEQKFVDARGVILNRYGCDNQEWTDKDKRNALLVCRRMDELARVVPFMRKKTALNAWDDPIGKCWDVLKDLVKEEQNCICHWREKWMAFENLGKKALARVKKREKKVL